MSLPTTPARSIARSTLSTPATAQHGTSPQELTPRSKVKAMLAAIDDDSGSEQSLKINRKPRKALSNVAGNIQKVDGRKNVGQEAALDVEGEEEDGEEEEESLFLPRGRLAARLNGQTAARQDSSPMNNGSADENAYARIKKQLLAGTTNKGDGPSCKSGKVASDHREAIDRLSTPGGPNTLDALSDCAQSPINSPARRQRSSPGLFPTPKGDSKFQKPSEKAAHADGSDSDLPANPQSNKRFRELVAKTQAKLEAKKAAEEQKRKHRIEKQQSFENELSRDAISDSGMSEGDGAAGRRLTQQARPTRKASKKALEEMSRETQRMSRNMQLAHQAKTKKKISKDSLFARFNFRTSATPTAETLQNLSSSTAVSSALASDLEEAPKQTPPTSPIEPEDSFKPSLDSLKQNYPTLIDAVSDSAEQDDDELPSMHDIMAQAATKLDKGKGKAIDHSDVDTISDSRRCRKTAFTQPPIRVHPAKTSSRSRNTNLDFDSDLEVLPIKQSRKSKGDVFDRLPASKVQEGHSLQTLRALAHLTSPGKQINGKKGNMSLADMQTSLQRRARQQAVEERAAKIEDLKSRGIIVQTAEERQEDQAEVEDLLEKARREGEEITQKEKRAAKKEKVANGEVADLPDTSDEDEDYQEEDEADVEVSGSEEEEVDGPEGGENLASDADESINEDDEDGGIQLDEDESAKIGLIDNEAFEDGDDGQEDDRDVDGCEEDDEHLEPQIRRSRRNKMVIYDDEDDEDQEDDGQIASQNLSPAVEIPTFFAEPLNFNAIPMGMTQAFAATMADTQTQGDEEDEEQDSMALLDTMPEPDFPMFDTNDSLQVVEDSQLGSQQHNTNKSSKGIDLHFSQSQITYDVSEETQGQLTATQISEIPDPTQDVGFILSSPAPKRFVSVPPSTVDTDLLSGAAANGSLVQKKRRRLQRRAVVEEDASDSGEDPVTTGHESAEVDTAANAFDAMKKASRAAEVAAAKAAFDKKKSEAKGMVEEQAQESEDEYAGLGGASDEESGREEDEEIKAMMDHGEVNVDERKLARFYADKERSSDEKAIEKLYKDINSGLLRRKRGADFELSDSDDETENRRKRKRREEAKMRAALLADENVGKIAEDPKKLAFLQTIEDRDPDDDLDFLDRPAEDSFRVEPDTQEDSNSQSQQPTLPAASLNKRKRPLQASILDSSNMRPPPAARRTVAPKKPATLAEIRESVSFLIEEPSSFNIAPDPSSSASEDEGNHGQESHRNPRRTPANPIIDRLSLKRAESASISSGSRLAFHDPATNPSIGGFKVPSLLRRATTSQLNANGADTNGISTAATERAAGGGEKGDFVRRGGTKRSSVNFISREKERRGVVELVEKRRREEREREGSRRRSGLGVLGVGSFE